MVAFARSSGGEIVPISKLKRFPYVKKPLYTCSDFVDNCGKKRRLHGLSCVMVGVHLFWSGVIQAMADVTGTPG